MFMRVLEAPKVEAPAVAGRKSGRRLRDALFAFGVAAVVVAVVAAGAVVVVRITRTDGPSHPDAWDTRVADLAEFVEHERDLRFHHPVAVEFLEPKEFEAQVRAEFDDVSEEDRALLESGSGMFRALGLAEGELDLLAEMEDFSGNGTLGQYLFDSERIVIRGDQLTLDTKATLVHELTHALQDQIFDIGERLQRDDDDGDSGLLKSIVEGDAEVVRDAWVEQLDRDDRAELERLEQAPANEDGDPYQGIPKSLVALELADYTVGQDFVQILHDDDGSSAVDRALSDPPRTDAQLLDPWKYVHDDRPAQAVKAVELKDGETLIDDISGDLGALGLYLVLAERIDPMVALEAVNGWASGDLAAFERDGHTCVRGRVQGGDPVQATSLERALQSWSKAMPDRAGSTVERQAQVVEFESCDPGPGADVVAGEGRSLDALRIVQTRSAILRGLMSDGASLDVAHCLAWAAFPAISSADVINDGMSKASKDAYTAAIASAAPRCAAE
jgi:hypothetical protein